MQRRILPALRCAFPYTIPILAGFAFLGMTYGIYMRVSGFGFWYPMLMSLLIFGVLSLALGFFGFLQAMGWLSGVPVLAFGIPAVLSCYFDIFSGAVQALVFSLLSMVYISATCPPPEEA